MRQKFTFGIVILAAGQSKRMGQLKPMVRLGGKSLLEHILANPFLHREDVHSLVVLGCGADAVRSRVSSPVSLVENRRYMEGRTTSIQCGLTALPEEVAGAFVWPVDCPLVPATVLDKLAKAFPGPQNICIPSYRFRRGHPPLIGASFFSEILSLETDKSIRILYQRHPARLKHVTVDSETILHNINSLEELRSIEERFFGTSA